MTITLIISLIGFIITIALNIYNIQENKKANIQSNLSKDQELCLNLVQLFCGNILKNKEGLEKSLEEYVKKVYPEYKSELNLFSNLPIWLIHKIRISTTSKRVHKILFYTQLKRYSNKENIDNYTELINYSLLYKELYKDFKGIRIKDLEYLEFAIYDIDKKTIGPICKKLKREYGLTSRGKIEKYFQSIKVNVL